MYLRSDILSTLNYQGFHESFFSNCTNSTYCGILSMIVLLGELTSGSWIKTPYHILLLPVIDIKKPHQPLALSRLVPLRLADDLSQ